MKKRSRSLMTARPLLTVGATVLAVPLMACNYKASRYDLGATSPNNHDAGTRDALDAPPITGDAGTIEGDAGTQDAGTQDAGTDDDGTDDDGTDDDGTDDAADAAMQGDAGSMEDDAGDDAGDDAVTDGSLFGAVDGGE